MNKIVRIAGGLALAGVLALTAACGGDDASDGAQNGDFAAFQECLEDKGVSLPQGGGMGGGMGGGGQRPTDAPSGQPTGRPTDRPSGQPTARPSGMPSMSSEQQSAFQECSSLMPQGGGGFPGGGQGGPGGRPDGGEQDGN
ncbi:PT domain-containing protein [Actinocorallia sp. A-T 12471]|uniref:PT domain-containing protein n=1 Tax=Actinocorallia sp. A-T 12471 TaxID=3089813 RepID=UPI0029D33C61|nr:PT domain-containing protein [Actinocorallia sp. A-T 12471]MDX6739288.1 PT domain-containing protein [Actinocorallia sp. A-T 12471]